VQNYSIRNILSHILLVKIQKLPNFIKILLKIIRNKKFVRYSRDFLKVVRYKHETTFIKHAEPKHEFEVVCYNRDRYKASSTVV